MADNGITKVTGGMASAGVPTVRNPGSGAARTGQVTTDAGRGSRSKDVADHRPPRQVINLDGRVLDRYAPRGTYLNLLV